MSLKLTSIDIKKNGISLFPPLSLSVGAGEIMTLMGSSGIGKSTLLAAIAGHLSPEFELCGEIELNNQNLTHIPMEKRNIGMLFQDALLFPHLSVSDNLAFGLRHSKTRKKDRAAQIKRALDEIGLEGFEDRDPATLSGGEAARIALQRALLAKPEAILLDEAFSRLDQNKREEMRELVFQQIQEANIPAILVTHDINDANAAQDKNPNGSNPIIELASSNATPKSAH